MKDIFIGIDGGGTKTKLRIEDSEGNLLSTGRGGPANIRWGIEKSWDSIYSALHQGLAQAHINFPDKNYRFHLGLGLAGTEVKADEKKFLARPHPFSTLILKSDAYVACLGGHAQNGKKHNGAIIIIGTGVIGYQIEDEASAQVGGWGFPHDDEGSGAWLGLQYVRATLRFFDGRDVEPDDLFYQLLKKFDNDLIALVGWANKANSSDFASLVPMLIEAEKAKNNYACNLLQKAAQHINLVSEALIKKQKNSKAPLPCCLFGGLAPFLETYLNQDVKNRLTPRQFDATKGAVLMVRQWVEAKI